MGDEENATMIDPPIRACVKCTDPLGVSAVECEKCENGAHPICVGLSDETYDGQGDWLCDDCVMDNTNHDSSKESHLHRLAQRVADYEKLTQQAVEDQKKLSDALEAAKQEAAQAKAQLKQQNDLQLQFDTMRRELTLLKTGRDYNPNAGAVPKISFLNSTPEGKKEISAWPPRSWELRLSEFDKTFSQLKTVLDQHTEETPEPQKTATEENSLSTVTGDRLDKLIALQSRAFGQHLTTFDGTMSEWGTFKQDFELSTIEGMYSEAENLGRLKKMLKGPAYDLVRDQLSTGKKASEILSFLEECYGRADVLSVQYLQQWLNHEPLKQNTDERLFSFAITAKTAVANLKTLGNPLLLKQEFVMSLLQEKLEKTPYFQRWSRKRLGNPQLDLSDFADFLMAQAKELPPSVFTKPKSVESSRPKARQVLTHAVNQKGSNATRSCANCSEAHGLWACDGFKAMKVDERWRFIRSKGICYACINSADHLFADCNRRRRCGIGGCAREHNRMLHADRAAVDDSLTPPGAQQTPPPISLEAAPFIPEQQVRMQNHHEAEDSVYYKIVPVRLFDAKGQPVETLALLDGGSGATLMDQSMFDRLGLDGSLETLTLQWTNSIVRKETTMRTSVRIAGMRNCKRFELDNVFAVKHLELPAQRRDAKTMQARFRHLRGLRIDDLGETRPTILIGLEHGRLLVESNTHQGGLDDPIASKTPLGWIVWGRSTPSLGVQQSTTEPRKVRHNFHTVDRADDGELHEMVKTYFTTENFGVTPGRRALIGRREQRAVDLMASLMRFENGRYIMPLLFEDDDVQLPDNGSMAFKRLRALEKKLMGDPALKIWYEQYIKDLLSKGYARVATDEDLNEKWPRVWYAPLFVVVNMNKLPPKPRVVADVAAMVNGVSLNSKLLKGPDITAPLLAGLCKFRIHAVGVNADVKEMFPQIGIRPVDQQCQRFIDRNCDQHAKPTVYIMQRMMFGPTCSPATAQFVKNHHANKFRDRYPEAVRGLIETTYVDDYFNSHPTVEEAHNVLGNAIEICASMGFDLVGAQSNSRELLKLLPNANIKPALVELQGMSTADFNTKILGMNWLAFSDMFTFKSLDSSELASLTDSSRCVTKREVLRTIMRTWDPLGLISHFRIQGKILLQEVWREGCGWDEPLGVEFKAKWFNFLSKAPDVEKLKIPRHYSTGLDEICETVLIIFVDASTEAFAATAYFRFEDVLGRVRVAQVMAKAKVAPIKQLTMPRLELQGSVLGKRIKETVYEMHPAIHIKRNFFLSDSTCVLQWIWSEHFKFVPFVAARVSEILDASTPDEWFHVRTEDNVADDATRFRDVDVGSYDTRWYQGPDFLRQPVEDWPISQELRKQVILAHKVKKRDELGPTDPTDDFKAHFRSNWRSIVNVTAYIRRAVEKMRKRPTSTAAFVTVEEFEKSECEIFRQIQKEAFPDEMGTAESQAGRGTLSQTSSLNQLSPFLDKTGVLRMSSRARGVHGTFAARNPAILPNKHRYVDLLVYHHHVSNKHMGEESTIADLRETVWIVHVRAALRRVISKCQFCKLKKAVPRMPIMGPLPVSRLDFGVKPFTHVGLDCFGPMNVRFGRGTAKRYGLIFTCLTYRAVHLELLSDLSLDQVMVAIQSLLARRGRVKKLHSDNGKNFVGANNQLIRDVGEIEQVYGKAAAEKLKIDWTFLPAYSPWMGGAWERLIQSIKKSIDFTLRGETPREDVLRGALIRAEYEMNRRPLTHTPVHHEDARPLTPNTAMFGEEEDNGPSCDVNAISPLAYRRVEHLCNKYMQRWVKEYLPEITRRSKWFKDTKPLGEGDLVIVIEPNEVKQRWRRGRIVRTHAGADGVIRSADVVLCDGTLKLNRAVGRLAALDVMSSSTGVSDGPGNVDQRSNI